MTPDKMLRLIHQYELINDLYYKNMMHACIIEDFVQAIVEETLKEYNGKSNDS